MRSGGPRLCSSTWRNKARRLRISLALKARLHNRAKPASTKVRVRITHDGKAFVAEGHVAYARNGEGMGIRFSSIEPNSVSILDGWLTELDNWVLSS